MLVGYIFSYSDLQKHESSCLLSDRFWCISPEPFELQKTFLPLIASLFKELSDKKGIFQIGTQIYLILRKTQKKYDFVVSKAECYQKEKKIVSHVCGMIWSLETFFPSLRPLCNERPFVCYQIVHLEETALDFWLARTNEKQPQKRQIRVQKRCQKPGYYLLTEYSIFCMKNKECNEKKSVAFKYWQWISRKC